MRIIALGFFVAMSIFLVFGDGGAQEKKDDPRKDEPKKDVPKYTIKEIMKKAYRGKKESPSLVQKALKGTADESEMKKLVEYHTALAQATPRKGDANAWKKLTADLLDAMQKNDVDALKKTSNCAACHKAFKK